MKRILIGFLAGLLCGAAAAWLLLRPTGAESSSESEAETAAGAPARAERETGSLHLDAAAQVAAGIAVAQPERITFLPQVPVYGRVLDASSLIAGFAELEAARATLAASEKEQARAERLFAAGGNTSEQAVELARAAAARDRVAVASARDRLAAAWGREVADEAPALLARLRAGGGIVRLDTLPGAKPAAKVEQAQVFEPGAPERTFSVRLLGPAAVADPAIPGRGFLGVIEDAAPSVGAPLRGSLPGAGETRAALTVPAGAVVYHQGSAWVFVLGAKDAFDRRRVTLAPASDAGRLVVLAGLQPDDRVAVSGAEQLLAAQLQVGTTTPEER